MLKWPSLGNYKLVSMSVMRFFNLELSGIGNFSGSKAVPI